MMMMMQEWCCLKRKRKREEEGGRGRKGVVVLRAKINKIYSGTLFVFRRRKDWGKEEGGIYGSID